MTVLGAVSAMAASCSSNAPIDMNYGKEAGTGFDAPLPDKPTGAIGGAGGNGDAGDSGGSLGGTSGAGGASDAGDSDAGDADDSDAGDGATAFFNFDGDRPKIDDNQHHYPNRLPNAGTA